MALDGGNQNQLAFVEYRGVDVVVREMAAAVIGIIAQKNITLVEAFFGKKVEGELYRQGAGEHELGNAHRKCGQTASGIEDGRISLIGLIED